MIFSFFSIVLYVCTSIVWNWLRETYFSSSNSTYKEIKAQNETNKKNILKFGLSLQFGPFFLALKTMIFTKSEKYLLRLRLLLYQSLSIDRSRTSFKLQLHNPLKQYCWTSVAVAEAEVKWYYNLYRSIAANNAVKFK